MRYIILILLILTLNSCGVGSGRYTTRQDRIKQKYYNSLHLNDKIGQEKYKKKLKKTKRKKWTHTVKEV